MAEDKIKATTESDVKNSVSSLYAAVLAKRKKDRAERHAIEEEERAIRKAEREEAKEQEKGEKLSKKEKREAEFDAWKSIVVGLTGDDLEYSTDRKKKKKKYRKWVGDDVGPDTMKPKEKKGKKKNYRKEFAPELNMLRSIVADQNRFTTELQRRFQNAAGPATKDAMPLNKTLVDLAAAVNASRSNALGYLNAISGIKKTVAELYLKQLKADGTGTGDSTDMALLGSNIGYSILGDGSSGNPYLAGYSGGPVVTKPSPEVAAASANPFANQQPIPNATPEPQPTVIQGTVIADENFDPETWEGTGLQLTDNVKYESIPKTFVLEWNRSTDARRLKAIDSEGKEIIGCPVPTNDPYKLKINEKELIAKGDFAETYKVEVI